MSCIELRYRLLKYTMKYVQQKQLKGGASSSDMQVIDQIFTMLEHEFLILEAQLDPYYLVDKLNYLCDD